MNGPAPTRRRRELLLKQLTPCWTSRAGMALVRAALLAGLWTSAVHAAPWLHPRFTIEEQQILRADTRALSLLDQWLDDSEIVLPERHLHGVEVGSETPELRISERSSARTSSGREPVCELRRRPVSFSEFVAARVHFVYPNRLVIPGLLPGLAPRADGEAQTPLPFPGSTTRPVNDSAPTTPSLGSSVQPPSGRGGHAPLNQLRARNESLLLIKQSLLSLRPHQESLDAPSGLPLVLHPRVGWLRLGERYFNADDVEMGIFESRARSGGENGDPEAAACPRLGDVDAQLSTDLFGGLIEVRDLSRVGKQLSRLATWVHEARHSDCSPGAFLSWSENPRILPGSRCGWVHSRCLPGSIYAGALACDATLGGAYGVQAEFFRRIHRACTRCSVVQRRAALIHLHEILAHLGPGALQQWRTRRRFKLSGQFELPEQVLVTGARRQSLLTAHELSLEFFLRTH